MTSRDLGEGGLWYIIAVHYPSRLMAKRAWERAMAKLNLATGDKGIGVIRLSPMTPTPGPSMPHHQGDLPDSGHPVVAVTLDKRTAQKCERLLRDGTPWTPTDEFADTLIFRRAKVVTEAQRHGNTGRLVVRRPEGRGASLDAAGNVYEQRGEG